VFIEFNNMVNMKKQSIVCSCGGGNGAYHPIAKDGCFRYHVTNKNEIPTNRRRWYNPDWWKEPVWVWDIGNQWITEYTLYNQRMYAQDENGNWTRPKSKESINSLVGNW
jgi:hypothetical protein